MNVSEAIYVLNLLTANLISESRQNAAQCTRDNPEAYACYNHIQPITHDEIREK